ncbi:MAG: FemAB family PEP-CTERM system-associated protein, partial [Burkholderiales bacterium]|nr:FemAB family PEP-CTERM system-associated protein [Burkholderiales bacterium]
MPEIQRLAPEDARDNAAWDDFVARHPQATFFHRAGWQRILREVFRHTPYYLLARQGGRITGVLPLAHVKSLLFGSALTSLPFAVYGGVVADDEVSAERLLAEAERQAARLGVAHLELRHLTRQRPAWPEQDLYVTFRKPLLPDEAQNLLAIPRKQRAMVRKGIKHGLKSEIDTGVDRFFALYADNVHRHGTPALPRRYFQALQREFGADCELLTVTAPDGRALSGVLSFYFRDEVLPYYAGDDLAARELAANDFKYWELMRRA